ncbi:MAG: hypothetical protein KF754_08050 [Planctomycetes bacterium]|nr:hypothetical protein [Planctomycetota bacterium]
MRYAAVCLCSLFVLAACSLRDGDEPAKDSAVAVAGQDLVIDIGLARVEISALNIGAAAGQIEPGSKVELKVVNVKIAGHKVYSPVVEVKVTKPDGAAATGLNLSPPAVFETSYDRGLAGADGYGPVDLALLKIDGTNKEQLTFTTTAPAVDEEWTQPYPGRARALLSSFSRLVMANRTGTVAPPAVVALSGTISTVATFTIFQLANTTSTISVNLAIPTADTTTPPAVMTLNDASFNATNPLAATNRVVTVTTGGITYTSDNAAASVVVQLNTFSGANSSGSMVGTVVQQSGGSATLAINYTWTTGSSTALALGGTVTDVAGRRTISLSDQAQAVQVNVVMPDTFPNAQLDPVTFSDATFDVTTPLDPAGRIVTVTEAGETFSSDVPVLGSVTITFSSFDSVTKTGAGTITGTVVSATPTTKALNYSFTTTAGGTGGGSGTFTPGTLVDVTTTDQADESIVVFNGTDYVAGWLSIVGTTNRTLEFVSLDTSTLASGTQKSFEPSVNLDPAAGLHAAAGTGGVLLLVGATGTNPASSLVHAVLYDYATGAGTDIAVGTGTFPRVVFNAQSTNFVIAWQGGADVMARAYSTAGAPIAAAITAHSAATIAGLAAAGGAFDEALITADDGSGIIGRHVAPGTGLAVGSAFDVSSSLSGGICAWDNTAGQYLVITETLILGFFAAQTVRLLAPGATTPLAGTLTLAALSSITGAVGGAQGVIFTDAATNLYAVKGGATQPSLTGNPVFGTAAGIDADGTADGPALATATGGNYVLAAARGADGVQAATLTIAP